MIGGGALEQLAQQHAVALRTTQALRRAAEQRRAAHRHALNRHDRERDKVQVGLRRRHRLLRVDEASEARVAEQLAKERLGVGEAGVVLAIEVQRRHEPQKERADARRHAPLSHVLLELKQQSIVLLADVFDV